MFFNLIADKNQDSCFYTKLQWLDFNESPTEEGLKLSYKHFYQVVVEHKRCLGQTQSFDTRVDTHVNKINEE